MKRLMASVVPVVILSLLLGLLYRALFTNPAHEMPSALIDQSMPAFSLPDVLHKNAVLSDQSFKREPIAVLNIWATWCYACRVEHELLMKIKNEYHVPVYGIAYKDDKVAIAAWLKKRGNPYTLLGIDQSGDVAIDFGIYGTPETFLIDSAGKVLYRHVGALSESIWRDNMLPIVNRYKSNI